MELRAKHERVDTKTPYFFPSSRKKRDKSNALKIISFPHLSFGISYLRQQHLHRRRHSWLNSLVALLEKKGSRHLAPYCGRLRLIIFILFVNNKWQFYWTKGTFGLCFGSQKKDDDDGNRQAIRQNTSLKTAFAGACGLKYVLDVLIYFFGYWIK